MEHAEHHPVVPQATALISLWIVYALVPHVLPLFTLHLVTLAMLAYGIWLLTRADQGMAMLVFFALIGNELLVFIRGFAIDLLLTITVSFFIFFAMLYASPKQAHEEQ